MSPSKKIIAVTAVMCLILLGTSPLPIAESEIKSIFTKNSASAVNQEDIYKKNLQQTSFNLNNPNYLDNREYWAVIIGIGDYPGENLDLPYSVNEIISFKNTLLNGGNWKESNINVLVDSQANRPGIFDAISWLESNADGNDVSIIYYAGHGGQSPSNEYLMVYNGSISDEELDEKLDDVEGRVVIILDACHSGGFIEEIGERNRVVLTSCKKDNLTYQYSKLESGIFGYFINISLEKYTKAAEGTFVFTYISCVYYTKKLSEKYGEDYTIYPCFYDGTLGRTKIINHHSYVKTFLYDLLSMSINNDNLEIWKM